MKYPMGIRENLVNQFPSRKTLIQTPRKSMKLNPPLPPVRFVPAIFFGRALISALTSSGKTTNHAMARTSPPIPKTGSPMKRSDQRNKKRHQRMASPKEKSLNVHVPNPPITEVLTYQSTTKMNPTTAPAMMRTKITMKYQYRLIRFIQNFSSAFSSIDISSSANSYTCPLLETRG